MDQEDEKIFLLSSVQETESKWYNMGFREGTLQGKLYSSQLAFDLAYELAAIGGFLSKAPEYYWQKQLQDRISILEAEIAKLSAQTD